MVYKHKNILCFIIVSLVLGVIEPSFAVTTKTDKAVVSEQKRIRNARLFVEASLAKNREEYNKAEALYLECLKNDPRDAASMYELASLYLSLERIDDAKNYAIKASEIDPQNTYYKALLASVYQTEGNYKASIEILKELLAEHPGKSDYIRQLAYIYIVDKNYVEAIELMNQLEKKTGISELIFITKATTLFGTKRI